MRVRHFISALVPAIVLALTACDNFEREVDLEIPPHERQLVVECYLEPGKPYRLVLTETVGFFDGPDTPFVEDALVVITHNGAADTLLNTFAIDQVDAKVYNYASATIVPADYNSDFHLYVRDTKGRELTATTRMLAPVSFDTLTYAFEPTGQEAAITVRWPDVVGMANYYRFTLHRDALVDGEDGKGLRFDFRLDDRIGDGEDFTISTLYFLKRGEMAICTVYHLTEDYWRHMETVDASADANGNPFANPVTIYSTVEGGMGVFAGLNYVRDTLIIPQ